SGQTLEAFLASIAQFDKLSVGINCALGAEQMRAHVEILASQAEAYVSCHPNAGLPNAFGGFDETPAHTARLLGEFAANAWVNLVGGCGGTTPAHIRAIADRVRSLPPRQRPKLPRQTTFSGLEPLVIRPESNFIMIGERTNITGSRRFARLIKDGNFEEALSV